LSRRDSSGRPVKKAYPQWTMKLFTLLASMKFLRGTRFDLFGYAKERRLDRQLIRDYRETVGEILDGLNSGNAALAVEIASLPEKIRGFGPVKMASIEQYRQRHRGLMTRFQGGGDLVNVVEIAARKAV